MSGRTVATGERRTRRVGRALAAVAVVVSVVVAGLTAGTSDSADAYQVNTTNWSGTAPATMTLPGGVTVTSTVTAPSALTDQGALSGRGATSAMFTPGIPVTTNAKRVDVRTTGCTYATGICANRGTWTITFSQPVTNPVLHFAGFGGHREDDDDAARFSGVPVLTGSSPAGASLGAASAGSTNMVVTGGTTIDRVNAYADVACNATTSMGAQAFAGCGSVPVVGTVTSLTFRLDARIAFLEGNPNAVIDSGQQDTFDFTVTTSEDFSDAPASYNPTLAPVHIVGDLKLGSTIDADNPTVANSTTSPFAVAAGADNNGTNGDGADENAFTTLPNVSTTGTYALTVPISGASKAGQVCGWVDFDKGGTFNTTTEQACATFAAGATSANLSWTVPAGATPGNTYARFRAAYGTVVGPTGREDSGEVEDYRLQITGPPLSCVNTIYGLNQGNIDPTHALLSMVPGAGTTVTTSTVATLTPASPVIALNGLAIAPGGTVAYATRQGPAGGPVVFYRYDTATGTVTSPGTITVGAGDTAQVMGGFDPTTARYYIGSYNAGTSSFRFYAYDTITNTDLGFQFSVPFAPAGGNGTYNGDLAFDASGRMYVVMSAAGGVLTNNQLVSIDAPLPTSGGVATAHLITYPQPSTEQWHGIAFGSDGYLYVQSSVSANAFADRHRNLYRIDPNTGTVIGNVMAVQNSAGVRNADSADLASCSYPSTLTLRKNVVGRAAPGDQFALSITGNGVTENNTGLTSGSTTGLQSDDAAVAGAIVAPPGRTYTITETGSAGANLANYSISWSCVDTISGTTVASGTGASGSVTMPSPTSGANVVCTITNTPSTPAISLDKSHGAITDIDLNGHDAGDTVVYSFVVTNTGFVTLTAVSVTDPRIGAPVTCPATTLAPGASMTCTRTYTLTQTDVDDGGVLNTATTTGTPPTGPNVTATDSDVLELDPVASIALVKTVDPEVVTGAGQVVTYSFAVTNTGLVTLTDLTVTEVDFSGTGTMSAIDCPVLILSPGASTTCTATYAVTAADITAGQITNIATATGTDASSGDPVVSDPDDAIVVVELFTLQIEKIGESTGGTWVRMDGSSFAILADDNGQPGAPIALTIIDVETGLFQIDNMQSGTYWLSELTAPEGFSLLAQPVQFVISPAGVLSITMNGGGLVTAADDLITVRDVPAMELPATGGPGSAPFLISGLLVVLAAGALGLILRRRNRRTSESPHDIDT